MRSIDFRRKILIPTLVTHVQDKIINWYYMFQIFKTKYVQISKNDTKNKSS
jgi:hypothetical protein